MDLYIENDGVIPTLKADGLTLRPLIEADADAIVSALSQWSVTKWLTAVPFPFGTENALFFINEIASDPNENHWAIDKGDGLLGVISIKPDLGYWLNPDFHGQGLMTCDAKIAIAYHFAASRDDLVSGCYPGNAASDAVLKRLGFVETHRENAVQVSTGKTVEIQRMKLSIDDWSASNA